MTIVGKREFMLHASKYLKKTEQTGEELVITHQNKPCLKLVPFKKKTIRDLKGIMGPIKVVGDINTPVFPGLDKW